MALLQRSEREELAPAVMDVAAAQGARLHKVVLLGGRPGLSRHVAAQVAEGEKWRMMGISCMCVCLRQQQLQLKRS